MFQFLQWLNGAVWGVPALVLILGVGLYLSLRTGFVQLTLFPRAMKLFACRLRQTGSEDGTVSPFQALCTALAATVGTGNIAGVAGAIAIGGPGSVFWMWICAVFGMVTKYAEATLALRYRVKNGSGEFVGGPMYMIHNGMGKEWHWLAGVYSFFGVIAAFGVGNATQINAVITGVDEVILFFGGTPGKKLDLLIGVILAALVSLMLLGGAKRIGALAEKLVPFASVAYLILGLGVLIVCRRQIPNAFYRIIRGAFSPGAVTGGFVGSAMMALRTGVARGVFTNEAGMGTASIAHASAKVDHPAEQGLMGIVEVFADTIVICTMTALVILCSGVDIPYGTDRGAALTTQAFAGVYGGWVSVLLAAALCCFAFATVLGWGLYGIRCAEFLFGTGAVRAFALLQAAVVVLGAVLETGTVWLLSEIVNGLMAIPNLITLAVLSPELVRLTNEYRSKHGRIAADGGTYENIHQCKPVRTVSYAEIPSPGGGGKKEGQDHLSSEYRPAGPGNAPGLL